MHVEVKTNMPGLSGGPAGFSGVGPDRQGPRAHARSNYDDLMYLYHPDVTSQLPGLGQDMLRLFGDATTPTDPGLLRLLNAQGIPATKARQAFEHGLSTRA